MSIAVGSTILWSDITAIYSSINNVRSRVGISGSVSPSGGGQNNAATAATMNSLRDQIVTLNNNSKVRNQNKLVTPAAVAVGDLIKATPWNNLKSQLDFVYNNVCTGCFGFSFDDCDSCYSCSCESDCGFGEGPCS